MIYADQTEELIGIWKGIGKSLERIVELLESGGEKEGSEPEEGEPESPKKSKPKAKAAVATKQGSDGDGDS